MAAAALACLWLAALQWGGVRQKFLYPWLPFLGWVALSVLASPQPLTGLTVLSRWASIAVFFALTASLWGESQRRWWFWGLGGCSLILAVGSFFIHDLAGSPFGLLPPYYNYTAFVEAAFFSAALTAWLDRKGPRGAARWACGALAFVALAQIFYCFSRGALVAAACGAGFVAFRDLSRRKLLSFLAVSVLVGGLAFMTLAKWRAVHAFKRPQIWTAAWSIAGEHPVFGAGPGQFANAFLQHNFPAGYGEVNYRFRAEHAHSELWETAAESGWPAALLLVFALWSLARRRGGGEPDWTRQAAKAACLAMSVQCLLDNMFQLPALGLLYASSLAVWRGEEGGEEAGGSSWRAFALAGLALAAFSWVPGRLLEDWQARPADPALRLELARRCVVLAPADPYLRERFAREWLEQKPPRVEEWLFQLERAEALSPQNAILPVLRAEVLRGHDAWPQVLTLAQRALALEPNFIQARLLLAEALARLGRGEEGRTELAQACRTHQRLGGNSEEGYAGQIFSFDGQRYEDVAKLSGGVRPSCF